MLRGTSRLVVDDEPRIADRLATILRNFGYEASVAYDAPSADIAMRALQPGTGHHGCRHAGNERSRDGNSGSPALSVVQDSAVFGAINGFSRAK